MRRFQVGVCALAAAVVASGCSDAGPTKPAPAPPATGPAQQLTLQGVPEITWTTSQDPHGAVAGSSPPAGGTGCYTWTQAMSGMGLWAAQIAGSAGGHRLLLHLEADGYGTPPLGTHPVRNGTDLPIRAELSVDGRAYGNVYVDPADGMPSYFTVEDQGTAGEISIRFAASDGAPQAYLVSGTWRCA